MAERAYNVRISFVGQDKASGVLGRIGGLLGKIGTIAGGILGANLFLGIGHQIGQMGRQAFEAVASYEQLGFTMESLIAREISRGQVVSTNSKTYATALFQEKAQWVELTTELGNANIRLRELQQGYSQLRREGDNSIGTQLAWNASIEKQKQHIQDVKDGLAGLTLWNNRYSDQMKGEVLLGTMAMSQAYEMASGGAKELLDWTQKLAIYSPFDMETVGNTIRMAMAYGFTTDEAKRLTKATIDYTAATGQSGEISERISRALGQVQAKGRLMGEEIRQLTDASIPVVQILAETFGKSTEEITKMVRSGLVPADDAVNAIIASMEGFEGVAMRQFTTWRGLSNAMGDVKSLGMQRVFSGIFEAFKPFAVSFIDFMTSEGFDKLEAFGTSTGGKLTTLFEQIGAAWRILTGQGGGFDDIALKAETIQGLQTARDLFIDLKNVFADMKEPASEVAQYLDDIAVGVGSLLVINKITGSFAALSTFLSTFGKTFGVIVAALGGPWALLAAGAIAFLYWAWTENFGGIQEILLGFWENTLKPFIDNIVPWFQETLPIAVETFGNIWATVLDTAGVVLEIFRGVFESIWSFIGPIFTEMSDLWTNTLLPALQTISEYLGTVFLSVWTILSDLFSNVVAPILDTIAQIWANFLWPYIQLVGDFLANSFLPLWQALGELFMTAIKKAIEIVYHALKWLLGEAVVWISGKIEKMKEKWDIIVAFWNAFVVPILETIHEWLKEKLQPVVEFYVNYLLPAFKRAFQFVNDKITAFIALVKDAIEWINNLEIPKMFQQKSPSPFEQSIMDSIAQLRILNSLPFLPQMQGVSIADTMRQIRDLQMLGLQPQVAIPNTFGGSGNGTFIPGDGILNEKREVHYHIATTLSQEELIRVLEDIQRSEGNF